MQTRSLKHVAQNIAGRLCLLIVMAMCLVACDRIEEQQSKPLSLAAEGAVEGDTAKNAPAIEWSSQAKNRTHLLLGTGSVQGVYFPIGGVICRLVNRHTPLNGIRCSLESTGGSIYNLRELRKGNFDLVFAQSDWQYNAYHGKSTFEKDGANEQLRAVFALEADPLALIVKAGSEINSFDDLANRRVSFGYARSLQHRIVNDLLAAKDWTDDNFSEVVRMSDNKQVGQLCADQLDAIILLTSSLTDHLQAQGEDCQLRFAPIEGPAVDAIIKEKPYYRTGVIPKNMHLQSEQDTQSFGLGATFVAMESTSPKAIYQIVKEIVENFKDFQSLHPSLQTIRKPELPVAGITAPLHAGAIRYYREARLIK